MNRGISRWEVVSDGMPLQGDLRVPDAAPAGTVGPLMPALLNRPLAAIAASAALIPLIAACGGSSGGSPDADPAAIVPARAPVYLEADIKPDGDAKEAVDELARKLGGVDDLGAELRGLIEKEAREDDKDFTWKKDVQPWIGNRVGIFLHELEGKDDEPEGAVVFPTKDPDKARDSLLESLSSLDGGKKGRVVERTYRDTKYKVEATEGNAVVTIDDYVVTGDESGIKAVLDARKAESLAETDAFKKSRDQVPDDELGFAYLGMRQVFSQLGPEASAIRPLLEQVGDQLAVALSATKDSIRVDSASIGVSGPGSSGPGKVFPTLPGDAWVAVGATDIGGTLQRAVEQLEQLGALGGVDIQEEFRKQTGLDVQRDLVSWMGDGGLFVTGTSVANISGALVVESKDPAATRRAIPRLARAASRLAGASVGSAPRGVDAGAVLRFKGLPLPITLALDGDRFVLAVGQGALDAATGGGSRLDANPAFRDAQGKLGDGIKPSFFVDMGPVRELVSGLGLEKEGPEAQRFLRALEAMTAIVGGGRRDGDIARGRVVVGVK